MPYANDAKEQLRILNTPIEKTHCPHCGADVTECEETEHGIFCPKCGNDFWRSETIPASEIGQYRYEKKYNMMIRG